MKTLKQNLENQIDQLAKNLPDWQEHLQNFRDKHPELLPQAIMKKAGFIFRMKKGKMFKAFINSILKKATDELLEEPEK